MLACACGGPSPEADSAVVMPTPDVARAALSTVLNAWRDGTLAGPIKTPSATLELIDTERKPNRPLRSFEILGAIEIDRFRAFQVKLRVDNPDEDQVVRYLVVGKDPLWVFRQEDFDRFSHWEHKMEEEEDPASKAQPGLNSAQPGSHGLPDAGVSSQRTAVPPVTKVEHDHAPSR